MRRTRHVIAVMVVATALCADRSLAAAPQTRAPSQSLARTIAARITRSFGQTVSVKMLPARTHDTPRAYPQLLREDASGVRSGFSPFEFRLPPPVR